MKLAEEILRTNERTTMNREDMLLLLDYNYWATDRVLELSHGPSADASCDAAAPVSGQTIHSTLVHTMDAERIWRMRCQGRSAHDRLTDPADFPVLADLLQQWAAEEHAIRTYVQSLTDADLSGVVRYRNTKGAVFEQTLWQILSHVVNHGTQHRGRGGASPHGTGLFSGRRRLHPVPAPTGADWNRRLQA